MLYVLRLPFLSIDLARRNVAKLHEVAGDIAYILPSEIWRMPLAIVNEARVVICEMLKKDLAMSFAFDFDNTFIDDRLVELAFPKN